MLPPFIVSSPTPSCPLLGHGRLQHAIADGARGTTQEGEAAEVGPVVEAEWASSLHLGSGMLAAVIAAIGLPFCSATCHEALLSVVEGLLSLEMPVREAVLLPHTPLLLGRLRESILRTWQPAEGNQKKQVLRPYLHPLPLPPCPAFHF